MRNHSVVTEFVLLGVSDSPELQVVIFIFLFIAYVLSVCGNLTIIILTLLDSQLKTPMYFFLRNFSFLEIIFTSVSIPRFLGSIITQVKTISYNNCLAQLFFFISMGVSEFFLLTAMSYDRYVAICKPAFSTCSSHMIVISISYGSCIFMYVKPSANERASLTKGVAVLNTSIAPMLNPFIYTLRNQQVKQAFNDFINKVIFLRNK
nr:olfactory receptor 6C3-like [Meriones unguiculatus]